jgi:hypothetical protein
MFNVFSKLICKMTIVRLLRESDYRSFQRQGTFDEFKSLMKRRPWCVVDSVSKSIGLKVLVFKTFALKPKNEWSFNKFDGWVESSQNAEPN